MATTETGRGTAVLAVAAAMTALVGNALAPRINGDDVDVYRRIADSGRFAAAGLIVLVALVLVVAAFAALTRARHLRGQRALCDYARLATGVGGAVAIAQAGLQLYAYRQQARAFAGANSHNIVSAFWATNALDHLSSAMFAIWTVVLLGLVPLLLGCAQLRAQIGGRLGAAAIVGGATCVVVGIAELLKDDQSTFDVPFAVGSVLVTLWLLTTGIVLWRGRQAQETNVTDRRAAARPA